MKITNMGQIITITASKPYTTEQLFEAIKGGDFGGATPELKKRMGFQNIEFPGAGGFVNLVSASKTTITMAQQKASKGGIFKSLGIDALTDGFGSLFNVEGRKNSEVMELIATEIERIVG